MKALILAAGYGTRLYPLTKDKPKPLLEINQKPIIDYLLDKLQPFSNLSEVIVVTNDKFSVPFEHWAKAKKFSSPMSVVNDGTKSNDDRLGSMGDIHFVMQQKHIEEDLLVLGGDNLFDQPLEDFVAKAMADSPKVTIGLYDIRDKNEARKFGVVQLDSKNQVVSFDEKPANPKSSLIGMCLYYLPAPSLNCVGRYLQVSKSADTSGDYIRWLYPQETVFGFKFDGKWYDIGSIEAYQEAQNEFQT